MIIGQEINGISVSTEEMEKLINEWETDKQSKGDLIITLFPTILLQLLSRDRID